MLNPQQAPPIRRLGHKGWLTGFFQQLMQIFQWTHVYTMSLSSFYFIFYIFLWHLIGSCFNVARKIAKKGLKLRERLISFFFVCFCYTEKLPVLQLCLHSYFVYWPHEISGHCHLSWDDKKRHIFTVWNAHTMTVWNEGAEGINPGLTTKLLWLITLLTHLYGWPIDGLQCCSSSSNKDEMKPWSMCLNCYVFIV